MRLFCLSEKPDETRVALTPETAAKLIDLGLEVGLQTGAGRRSQYPDALYREAGVSLIDDPSRGLAEADIVFRVRKPEVSDFDGLKANAIHLSLLDPFNAPELLEAAASRDVRAVSMEMMPRTTLAQKMDVLSSQANLAGYFAVIRAAERMDRMMPMMMTPAGTIAPARVFVIGVGVAGLQAIATAKRLGARVDAFDTRPVVEEQVRSLGAKFVKIDLGETGQTDQGYAKELTPEQIETQRKGMAKVCAQSDLVITTAKLFGRPAPRVVTAEMVAGMKPGSVIVDLAAETGGNVEGTRVHEEVVTDNGVTIIGTANLEACIPHHASQVYAANLANLIEHFWDKESKTLNWDLTDEILKGCVLTDGGQVVHERFRTSS
ncbi:Re/Si-specific NAD(P)(+) transhydrogenase subunit alpha [Mucisphaera calidilacus]|uniref:proton-translocating NAD(P)(+) transhydrogenase n=1 Tax=Mucisphaera calidilacus TaxID=2527982 RepID=A0A518C0S7_9BACT|nr:Re/Si-specific NAD(P)(+) transhydrogenase subunit alpha [Mucisphaera calidilacus]QDU72835.1 NAD(P) transhydrogenase subunit alpha part 1 [Mucisphaera calidilacus]